jgi:hypothetical protein
MSFLFKARRDLVARKNETNRGDGDVETPAAAEHDEHEVDFHFDSNVLATQLGGVGSRLRRKKNTNAPELRVVRPLPFLHNPTQLAKGKRRYEKASRSCRSVSLQVLYRADSQWIVCLKQMR